MSKICTISNCERQLVAVGLCMMHYKRKRKYGDPTLSRPNPVERFWAKVVKTDTCWEWNATRNHRGYGKFRDSPHSEIGAHRYSYILHKGEIGEGMEVMHTCDNPPCVNPDHLLLGTAKDNAEDRTSKRRTRNQHTGPLLPPRKNGYLIGTRS